MVDLRVGRVLGLRSVCELQALFTEHVPEAERRPEHIGVLTDILWEFFSAQLKGLEWASVETMGPPTQVDVKSALTIMLGELAAKPPSRAAAAAEPEPEPEVGKQRHSAKRLVLLVPNDKVCGKCGEGGLLLSRAAGRTFEVRFLGLPSLSGVELQKTCAKCGCIHLYSELRWSVTRADLVAAALTGKSLPCGEQRSWKADAGGLEYFRFPANAEVAYQSDLLRFSALADERVQLSKQGLQSISRLLGERSAGAPSPRCVLTRADCAVPCNHCTVHGRYGAGRGRRRLERLGTAHVHRSVVCQ